MHPGQLKQEIIDYLMRKPRVSEERRNPEKVPQSSLALPELRERMRSGEKIRIYDGGGLLLEIHSPEWAYWFFRYTRFVITEDGERKPKDATEKIGAYHTVGLAAAREKARELREKRAAGIDLKAEGKARETKPIVTLAMVWAKYRQDNLGRRVASGDLTEHYVRTLDLYYNRFILPALGTRDVTTITTDDCVDVIKPVYDGTWQEPKSPENARPRSGRRPGVGPLQGYWVQKVLEWMLDHAKAPMKVRTGENPALWRNIKPSITVVKRRTKHHTAIGSWRDAPAFMQRLQTKPERLATDPDDLVSLIAEVMILLGARSGEIRNARWRWVHWQDEIMIVPEQYIKGRIEHAKPLPPRVMEILKDRYSRRMTDDPDELIFPQTIAALPGFNPYTPHRVHVLQVPRPFSDKVVLRRVKECAPGTTQHGFRSTFKHWAVAKKLPLADLISELCIAHKLSETKEAYLYAHIEERREMLTLWAQHCGQQPTEPDGLPPMKVKRAPAATRRDEIAARRLAGETCLSIGRDIGFSKNQVQAVTNGLVSGDNSLEARGVIPQLLAMREAGKSVVDIAKALGADRNSIRRVLRERGIPDIDRPYAASRVPQIVALAEAGVSASEIGRRLGIHQSRVCRLLGRTGPSRQEMQAAAMERTKQIVAQRRPGETPFALARRLGVPVGSIRSILSRHSK